MGKTLYLLSNGELKRKDNTLFIARENENPKFLPVETLGEINIFGEVDFNKSLLEFISQKEVILHFYNHYGYYVGTFYPREHLNSGAVILAQAAYYMDAAKRIEIASSFVIGAIDNMKRVMEYYQRRAMVEISDIVEALDVYSERAPQSKDVAELMGIEGNSREKYYEFFDRVVKDDAFKMVNRTRRPPSNRMNALISFS